MDMFQTGLIWYIQYPEWLPPYLPLALGVILCIVAAYLLGSINTAVIVSRLFYGEDIRKQGSGNAGLTNMNRVYGKKAAGLVLLGDVLKMVLSLLFAAFLFTFRYHHGFATMPMVYLAGAACILGHVFPIYFRFKGGKGVLCTAAMVLVLSPLLFAIEIVIFALVLWGTKYVSVSSMSVGLLYPLLLNRLWVAMVGPQVDLLVSLVSVFIALFIIYCHRENITRLKEGRENKFSFRKKQ